MQCVINLLKYNIGLLQRIYDAVFKDKLILYLSVDITSGADQQPMDPAGAKQGWQWTWIQIKL